MNCRLSFRLVCLLVVVGGICILALQIVAASTRAWVAVAIQQSSLSFGIFNQEATIGQTLTMARNSALVCLQAMVIFSVGFGSTAVISILIGGTQRQICGRGTYFYVRIADICFVLAAITNLVGIAVFTHFWMKEPHKFFNRSPGVGASYNYGYAYMLGWLVFFLQAALAVFTIVGIHVIVRKYDKGLLDGDDSNNERKKLVNKQAAKKPENKLQEGSSKMPNQSGEPTSNSEKVKKQKADFDAGTSAEGPKPGK